VRECVYVGVCVRARVSLVRYVVTLSFSLTHTECVHAHTHTHIHTHTYTHTLSHTLLLLHTVLLLLLLLARLKCNTWSILYVTFTFVYDAGADNALV